MAPTCTHKQQKKKAWAPSLPKVGDGTHMHPKATKEKGKKKKGSLGYSSTKN
jgi:hypothetical protein